MPVRRTRSKVSSDSSTNGTPFIPLTEAELHELIAARAYELYLQRPTGPGDELADWLLAEKDVHAIIQTLSVRELSVPVPPEKPVASPVRKARATRVRSTASSRKTPVQNTPA